MQEKTKEPREGEMGGKPRPPGDDSGKRGGQWRRRQEGRKWRDRPRGRQDRLRAGREALVAQAKNLPRRPGEYGPDDIRKKGGAPLENPNVEEPTDLPGDGADVREPPA